MSDEKHEHKHYHFNPWPEMPGGAWEILFICVAVVLIVHACTGYVG